LKTNDYHNALRNAKKAHGIFPAQLRPKLLLGIIHYSQDEQIKAKTYITECINGSQGNNRTNMLQINQVTSLLLQELNHSNFDTLSKNSELYLRIDSILIGH
jgi:hypothetical protein